MPMSPRVALLVSLRSMDIVNGHLSSTNALYVVMGSRALYPEAIHCQPYVPERARDRD